MITDVVSQALALQQTKIQFSAEILVMKKQRDMDKMLLEMVESISKSAPPPSGQGTRVDKSA